MIRFFHDGTTFGKRFCTETDAEAFGLAVDHMRNALAVGGHMGARGYCPPVPLQVVDMVTGRIVGTVTADGVRALPPVTK